MPMKRCLSKLVAALAVALALMLPLAAAAHEHGHGHTVEMKPAVLLVTFGTSVPQAQAVFAGVDQAFKKAFPQAEVRWAYTSHKVRQIVREKQGKNWLSPQEALAKLMAEGYTHVAVQSLHVIPGAEYHDLVRVVQGFRAMGPGFKPLLGYPLCATTDDLQKVAQIAAANLPPERKKGEAVVFMGHGTHHPAGVAYPALAYVLRSLDPLLFMGTVEGYPSLNDVVAGLKARQVKKAYLIPFMTVAGDHAMNDMAGDDPDSWKSVLAQQGIQAVPVMRALTQIPAIVDLYISHARIAYSHFK